MSGPPSALVNLHILALIAFVWVGMIIGVSGLATPVKFTAPSLTRPVALDVGRVTFRLFSRVEWVFAVVLLVVSLVIGAPKLIVGSIVALAIVLAVQGAWLLPVLNARAIAIAQGDAPIGASPHRFYVLGEAIKLALLFAIGLMTI